MPKHEPLSSSVVRDAAVAVVSTLADATLSAIMTSTLEGPQDLGFRIVKLEPAGVWMGTTTDDYRIYNEDEHRPDHAVELFTITKEYGRG